MKEFRQKEKTRYEIVSNRIISATPLICMLIYLFIGFELQLWHPGWVIFLAVPVVPIILKPKGFKAAFPMFIALVYVLLGLFIDWWHPGWIIFLSIPIFYILFPDNPHKKKTTKENINKDEAIDAEIDA